jgi:hypothetical protein
VLSLFLVSAVSGDPPDLDPTLPSASLSGVPEGPPKPKPTGFPRLPPPPAGLPKPTDEPNELGFVEDDGAVPKRLGELTGLSLPKRVLVGAELPKTVLLELNVEDEPKGEVPNVLEPEVPKSELDPVAVTEGPDEAVESGGGKENPDDDVNSEDFGSVEPVAVDEFEPNEPKPENAGGACVDDGFGSGAADSVGTLLVDGLVSNSV